MKFPPIYAAMICAGLMAAPAQLSGQPAPSAATNALGPRITFLTNEYHFGRVTAGTLVKYTFIVSNAGDQTLEISRVTPGCHCTTAGDWSHKVEPGQTGKIPIQFDSGSFRGDVSKTITVASNDKRAPNQTLALHGTVWRAIEVTPQFAYINVLPDSPSNVSSVVHITNQTDEPVTLSEPTSANGSFKGELKTIKPGKEYELTVTAVQPLAPGNTSGTIFIKTSFTNMPVLNVTAVAMVQPAIVLTPDQIRLSPQLDGWTTNIVTITGKGSKLLALSDPEASDARISVQLKEITPGRVFQLAAVFPPGFQIAHGQRAQVSVKSNSPERPVINVSIMQYHPAAMTQPVPYPKPMSQTAPPPPAAHP
jgi:hypothetical protein